MTAQVSDSWNFILRQRFLNCGTCTPRGRESSHQEVREQNSVMMDEKVKTIYVPEGHLKNDN